MSEEGEELKGALAIIGFPLMLGMALCECFFYSFPPGIYAYFLVVVVAVYRVAERL